MGKEINTEWGNIKISQEVVATIAGGAAVECYGLVGMASRKITDGFADILGKESLSKGVEVEFHEGGVVSINIYIIVNYGVKISEVAHNVQEKVKYAVEKGTGLKVQAVNITVQGVRVTQK